MLDISGFIKILGYLLLLLFSYSSVIFLSLFGYSTCWGLQVFGIKLSHLGFAVRCVIIVWCVYIYKKKKKKKNVVPHKNMLKKPLKFFFLPEKGRKFVIALLCKICNMVVVSIFFFRYSA